MFSRFLMIATIAFASLAYAQTTQPAGPVRISVDLDNVLLSEAIKTLSAQTGVAFQLSPGLRFNSPVPATQPANDTRVTFKADNQPITRVVADFLLQAKCSVSRSPDQGVLPLVTGEPLAIVPVNDHITILVQSIVVDGTFSHARGETPKRYNYTIQCTLLLDPSLRAIGAAAHGPAITELQMPVAQMPQQYGTSSQVEQIEFRRFSALNANLRFSTTERATSIEKLVASWQVLCATEEVSVAIEAADLINGGENGTEQLTISAPPAGNDQRNGVQFSLRGTILKQYKDHPWQGIFGNGAIRVDGVDGAPLADVRANRQGRPGEENTFRIYTNRGGMRNIAEEIDRIQVVLPTKAKFIEVPIVLTDLKMP